MGNWNGDCDVWIEQSTWLMMIKQEIYQQHVEVGMEVSQYLSCNNHKYNEFNHTNFNVTNTQLHTPDSIEKQIWFNKNIQNYTIDKV